MSEPSTSALDEIRAALKRVSALLIVAALLFSWLSPNHYYPWTTFHGQFAAALALGLLAPTVLADHRSAVVDVPALAVLAVLAAAVPWLQFAVGVIFFVGDALAASLFLLLFAFALVVGHSWVVTRGLNAVLSPLAWLYVVGGLVSVWLALYQWQELDYLFVFVSELAPGQLPIANFAQSNQLGTMLVLGVVGCAFLYSAGHLHSATALLLLAMLGFGIAMTGSRAALLQLLCIALWLAVALRRVKGTINWKSILAASAVVAICVWIWPQLQVHGSSLAREVGSLQTAGARPIHWISMLTAALQSPWLGHGWNQVSVAQFAVAPLFPATFETLGESHNLFIDLLVWNGLLFGGLLILALVAWFAWALSRRQSIASALALAAVIGPFVHAMVEFPLHYLYFLLPTALLMGAATAELRPAWSWPVPKWAVFGVFGCVCVAGLAMSLEYVRIESAMRAARFEAARIGLDGPRLPTVRATMLTQHAAFIEFARTPERVGMTAQELEEMRRVTLRYPHSSVIVRYASALARNGRPEEAEDALLRICKIRSRKECSDAQQVWTTLSSQYEGVRTVTFPAH